MAELLKELYGVADIHLKCKEAKTKFKDESDVPEHFPSHVMRNIWREAWWTDEKKTPNTNYKPGRPTLPSRLLSRTAPKIPKGMCIKSRTARRSTSDNATKPGPLSDQLYRYNSPSPEPALTASSLQALPVCETCRFVAAFFFLCCQYIAKMKY